MTKASPKQWLASLAAILLVAVIWPAQGAKADPVPIDWFVIEQYLGQFNNQGALFRGAEIPVQNPHGCTNPYMHFYEVAAGDGARLINAMLLAAYVSNREVYLWVDGCTAGGLPKVVQAVTRR